MVSTSQSRTGELSRFRLSSVWRYPVKSILGGDLDAAPLGNHGIVGDRAYYLRDLASNRKLTARTCRRMLDLRAGYVAAPEDGRPIPPVRIRFPNGDAMESGDPDLDRRLSEFLQGEVRFVAPESSRPPNPDAGALLIVTTATLAHLQGRYPSGRFDAHRFRPNLVVDTGPAGGFVEAAWQGRTLAIGEEVRVEVGGTCPRCVMTTLPQGDLPEDPGILLSVKAHTHGRVGAYGRVLRHGTVRKGDAVVLG